MITESGGNDCCTLEPAGLPIHTTLPCTVIEGVPVERQLPRALPPLEALQRKTEATDLRGCLSVIATHSLCAKLPVR